MTAAVHERDLEAVRDGFARWWRARRPDAADVRVAPLTRPSAGLPIDTLMVDVAWREGGTARAESLVVRLLRSATRLSDYDLSAGAHPDGAGVCPSLSRARSRRLTTRAGSARRSRHATHPARGEHSPASSPLDDPRRVALEQPRSRMVFDVVAGVHCFD
jgi:hypothetical protein